MAVNTTQGIVLAIFGANAGGHLSSLDANATANGNASLATDLSAAAGLILGVDLSSDAAFTSTVLGNLGIAEDSAGYTLASNYFTTNLAAGAGRGDLVASAVEYLLGSSVDASLADAATAFTTRVTDGVTYSQGEGAAVFGVAQLQSAAGSAATAGAGDSFELTTDDDTLSGTAGNDTFTAAAGTMSADDSITDSSTTDNDTLNVTASSTVVMDVTNVENVNINWDGYATPTYDLSDVSGSTVTLSSTKAGYLGSANFDNVGSNNLTLGAGVTGTVTVDGAEDSTITNTSAETLTIGVGAAGDEADGNMVVDAGAAETVTIEGGDSITLTALSADDITATGGSNLADVITVNAGVDADLTVKGASDAVVNLNSDADITLTIAANGATNYETINLGGTGAIELDINETLANLATEFAINGGGVVTLGGTLGSADLSLVEHTDLRLEDSTAGATINLKNGANVTLEATLAAGTTTFSTTDDYDTSSDVLTLTLEDEQDAGTTVIDVNGSAGENDFETLNLVIDPNSSFVNTADFNIDTITGDNAATDGSGTMVNITSADADVEVTIGSIAAKQVDASGVAGEFDMTQANVDEDITVIAAADATTASFQNDNDDATFISGNDADDVVNFDTTIGTAVAQFAGGDNSVTLDNTLGAAGTIAVVGGTGAETVTISAAAAGTISLQLGDGDNVIDLANLAATAEASVVLGTGDDEVSIDTGASGATAVIDFGTGSNTLKPDAEADLTDMTLTLTNLDVIQLTAATAGDDNTDALFKSSSLDGESYEILGGGVTSGVLTDELGVEIVDGAGSLDLSSLQLSDGLTDGVLGAVVTFADADENTDTTVTLTSGSDTISVTAASTNGDFNITGGAGNDTITTGDGDDVILGGTGNDVIDSANGDDTIEGGAGFDIITAGAGDDHFDIGDDHGVNFSALTFNDNVDNDGTLTLGENDTIEFVFGEADVIYEFDDAGDDVLDFAEVFSSVAATTANDLGGAEGTITFVRGTWVEDANSNGTDDAGDYTFEVDPAGADLLVSYDANGSSSTLDQEILILDGITSLTLSELA